MPYEVIIPLVIIAVILIVIVVAVYKIKSGIRNISRSVFGTDSIIEGVDQQRRRMSETPRSLQAMTSLYLPRIEKDFPEFDYSFYKMKTQALLRSYFDAVENKDVSFLKEECSVALKNNVAGIIEGLGSEKLSQFFNQVVLHDTQISRYIKNGKTVTIILVTSVGYYTYIQNEKGEVVYGDKNIKEQTVYETELVYVQDADKIDTQGASLGLTCPNCGAPITNLGQKFCEYCGTGVTEVNIRSWKFNSIKEQTVNKKPY